MIGLNTVTTNRDGRAKPDVSENGTSPAQPDGLEADPLTVLPELEGQEPRQTTMTGPLHNPPEHGGLAATGRAGQEQVLGCPG